MPRYFFHTHYDHDTRDEEGIELPDLDTAWSQASQMAGQVLRDLNGKLEPGREWRLEACDEAGTARFALRFSGEIYAA